jgi:ATP-dependent Clp protease ATP-binding subunit ClpX
MELALIDIMYDVPSQKNLQKCIITRNVIEKKAAPELIYKARKKTA